MNKIKHDTFDICERAIGPAQHGRQSEPYRRLTRSCVESLKPRVKEYEVGDPACTGLQLRMARTGSKSWHWRFSWKGKRVRLCLGTYPAVNLAEAHQQSEVARALLRRGIDPRRAGMTAASRARPELMMSALFKHRVWAMAAAFDLSVIQINPL